MIEVERKTTKHGVDVIGKIDGRQVVVKTVNPSGNIVEAISTCRSDREYAEVITKVWDVAENLSLEIRLGVN